MVGTALSFREGSSTDLPATFALSEHAIYDVAARQGVVPAGRAPSQAAIRSRWLRHRSLIEFVAFQPHSRYWICENGDGLVGYARVARFGAMEQLTELMVAPEHQGRGIGRALLERCWPGDPTPELGRVVVATGTAADLSLYTSFGVMPVAGHWHMRQRTEAYLERRSPEEDVPQAVVNVLARERAIAEWHRLEPLAIGYERPLVHEFFGDDRTCLAAMEEGGQASALCWVSGEGDIGPAVGATPESLVRVALGALDRIARVQAPEHLSVFCTTTSWRLLRRLRTLGFYVYWPSWIMCSVPLPGLDRYLPTRPPHIL